VIHRGLSGGLAFVLLALSTPAGAVSSSELYQTQTYTYGRFEARLRFAAGDGVVSSFFLWKPGSEVAGTFWNELDFEKLGADCHLQTNPLYGAPVADHSQIATVAGDLCGEYHTYEFEWTPTYIAYRVDGAEVRRDVGETADAFAANASGGMQIHFNVWPGDASFGGNFDAAILPVQQYISWVQYSSFADGEFTFEWREDFAGGTVPNGWSLGNWPSPKSLSTHQPANAGFIDGFAVLSLTADDATGFSGTPPVDEPSALPGPGDSGSGGSGAGMPETSTAGSGGTGTAANAPGGAGGDASNAAAGAIGVIPVGGTVAGSSAQPSPRAASDATCSHVAGSRLRSNSTGTLLGLALGFLVARQRRPGNRTFLKR
jgi:endo-1,3-1,4-beta-glycanase ExoK